MEPSESSKTVPFTDARVRRTLACERGRPYTIWWDENTRGLGLKVTAPGRRKFIFDGRINGKTFRMDLGDVSTLTLGDAQTKARLYRTKIDEGIDPRHYLAIEAAEAAKKATALSPTEVEPQKIVTVREAWNAYLVDQKLHASPKYYDDHVSLASAGGERRKRSKLLTKAGPLAALMPLPLTELKATCVAQWLTTESKTRPTSTHYSYRLLRAFVRWCNDDDQKDTFGVLIPDNACSSKTVLRVVPKTKPKLGDALERGMLKAWFDYVRQIKNPMIRAYLQCLLLTGARRGELGSLKWDAVDFEWRSLTIRDKIEGERVIPMTPHVRELLLELKNAHAKAPKVVKLLRGSDGEDAGPEANRLTWVFASASADAGALVEPRIAHDKALKAAGLPHITLHGLRRSFLSLSNWCEAPAGVAAQLMGHRPSAVAEKHYQRRELDFLRQWHDRIERWILNEASIEQPAAQGAPKVAATA